MVLDGMFVLFFSEATIELPASLFLLTPSLSLPPSFDPMEGNPFLNNGCLHFSYTSANISQSLHIPRPFSPFSWSPPAPIFVAHV